MFILDNGCGWIPDAPIKFIYHLINLLKNLTPIALIIMGSLDFGKAVMAGKEDQIKKAQSAFIKKVIAGAAVFFVFTFAKWIVTLINNAGGDTGNALNCVSLLLTGDYNVENKTYYEGPSTTTESTFPHAAEDNALNSMSTEQLLDILLACNSFSSSNMRCSDARTVFCEKNCSGKNAYNDCIKYTFGPSADLNAKFGSNNSVCKIDNISSYVKPIDVQKCINKECNGEVGTALELCKRNCQEQHDKGQNACIEDTKKCIPNSCSECRCTETQQQCYKKEEELNNQTTEKLTKENCMPRLTNIFITVCKSDKNNTSLKTYDDLMNQYDNIYDADDELYNYFYDRQADTFTCQTLYSYVYNDQNYEQICSEAFK